MKTQRGSKPCYNIYSAQSTRQQTLVQQTMVSRGVKVPLRGTNTGPVFQEHLQLIRWSEMKTILSETSKATVNQDSEITIRRATSAN